MHIITAILYYDPLSSGSLRAGVSTGESGQTLPVGLDWLDFPDIFTTGDGQHLVLNGTQSPDRYERVYPVVPASSANGLFELELRDEASNANTQPFLVLRDATAPAVSDLGLSLGGEANAFLEGNTLYFGPQSTGVLTVTVSAQDAGAGVKQVSFPALFGTGAANDASAPYQQDYAIQGSSVISGTFQLEAMDNVGNTASSETFTVTKDNAAPVVNIYAPSQPGLLFAVSWAGQDNLTGVGSYELEYRQGAGNWTAWLSNTTQTEAEFSGADGQGYTFRVRAVDRVGNISAWVESSSAMVQTVTKYYTFGGRRIAERQGSSIYYLHPDHLGSVILVTDDSGGIVSQSRYLPYGEMRWTGGTKTTDISYTGQRVDSFGLMDYRARFYSPKLGRFISPDSIIPEASQGTQAWDRYAGMNNNPVRWNDPSGHCLVLCTALIGGVIGAIAGAVTYTLANPDSFDTGEMWAATGAGAVAGALIGSGVGILAAPATTAAVATAATAMVGAGTGAAGSAIGYTVTSPNSFETTPFIETTAVGGAVGGISATIPVSSLGVAAKTATYIAGSETLYALQTDKWTVEGAQRAAIYGVVGAGFDVGLTTAIGGQSSSLAKVFPSTQSVGYLPPPSYYEIMSSAAKARAGSSLLNAPSSIIAGVGAATTTTLLNNYRRR